MKLTFNKNKVAWEESGSEGTGGKYIESKQHITRSREKSREKGRAEFISTVKNDVWGSSVPQSQSGRTGRAYAILGVRERQSTQPFSAFRQHLTPFVHSNNRYGSDQKYKQPSHGRIYNKSIKQPPSHLSKSIEQTGQKSSKQSQGGTITEQSELEKPSSKSVYRVVVDYFG